MRSTIPFKIIRDNYQYCRLIRKKWNANWNLPRYESPLWTWSISIREFCKLRAFAIYPALSSTYVQDSKITTRRYIFENWWRYDKVTQELLRFDRLLLRIQLYSSNSKRIEEALSAEFFENSLRSYKREGIIFVRKIYRVERDIYLWNLFSFDRDGDYAQA